MNAFERESEIRTLAAAIEACGNRSQQCALFAQMAALIQGRSQQTIAAMEAARGLRVVGSSSSEERRQ